MHNVTPIAEAEPYLSEIERLGSFHNQKFLDVIIPVDPLKIPQDEVSMPLCRRTAFHTDTVTLVTVRSVEIMPACVAEQRELTL